MRQIKCTSWWRRLLKISRFGSYRTENPAWHDCRDGSWGHTCVFNNNNSFDILDGPDKGSYFEVSGHSPRHWGGVM